MIFFHLPVLDACVLLVSWLNTLMGEFTYLGHVVYLV